MLILTMISGLMIHVRVLLAKLFQCEILLGWVLVQNPL